jgi:molybdopterin-binding protein
MNQVKGTIRAVESDEGLILVSVESAGDTFSALMVETAENRSMETGMTVFMAFRETETAIGKDLSGGLSVRNRFPAVITAIAQSPILTKITLDFRGTQLSSVITSASAKRLELQIGDTVEALVKTTDMSLIKTEP